MNSDIKNKWTTTKYLLHPICTQQNLNSAKNHIQLFIYNLT